METFQICLCGAQPGYPHAADCPRPSFDCNTDAEVALWEAQRLLVRAWRLAFDWSPDPWHVGARVPADQASAVDYVGIGNGSVHIARAVISLACPSHEAYDNAQLIAAAPALFCACVACVQEVVNRKEVPADANSPEGKLWARLSNALQKAVTPPPAQSPYVPLGSITGEVHRRLDLCNEYSALVSVVQELIEWEVREGGLEALPWKRAHAALTHARKVEEQL